MTTSADGRIRVVIADDIAETRENLSKLLYFEKDIVVVGNAATGQEAIEQAGAQTPDIVLMDINMPGMDGIAATEAISSRFPATQVIMMSVQGEQDYLRRSMLAGAREFLVKPFSGDELVRSIRHVHEVEIARRSAAVNAPVVTESSSPVRPVDLGTGRIISVFSPKGGIGKTTIASNLAVSLSLDRKSRVALVDGSLLFGDVGIFLNLVSNKTIADIATRVDQLDAEYVSDVMVQHSSGVRVLLAPIRPEMAELINGEVFKRVLDVLRRHFDYVVVDTRPSFDESSLAILDMADRIVAVMNLEIPAIKDMKLFLELTENLGYAAEKVLVVLNRSEGSADIQPEVVEQNMRRRIDLVIESDRRTTSSAINQGTPLVIGARDSVVAKGINQLAQIIRGGPVAMQAQKAVASSRGFSARLRTVFRSG